jgi:hypothetical protein
MKNHTQDSNQALPQCMPNVITELTVNKILLTAKKHKYLFLSCCSMKDYTIIFSLLVKNTISHNGSHSLAFIIIKSLLTYEDVVCGATY